MGFLQRLFRRRPPVPPSARKYLEQDERVLGWAEAVTGQIVVTTPRGLHVVDQSEHRLVPWHEISKATWADRWLSVIESEVVQGSQIRDASPWRLQFDEPGGVPPVLRERVTSAVVSSTRYSIAGGVLIVARKVTAQDGLLWQYRLDHDRELHEEERAQLEGVVESEAIRHKPTDL
ncbi:hypothetical protein [Cumulibacter soli]|uniref:hypothetical protein n=1 Tax=Cumulibacter soli TaxID=2546344 RepID=UPI0010679D4B|nr:hypothetical protein [Cumulibacter soli]